MLFQQLVRRLFRSGVEVWVRLVYRQTQSFQPLLSVQGVGAQPDLSAAVVFRPRPAMDAGSWSVLRMDPMRPRPVLALEVVRDWLVEGEAS